MKRISLLVVLLCGCGAPVSEGEPPILLFDGVEVSAQSKAFDLTGYSHAVLDVVEEGNCAEANLVIQAQVNSVDGKWETGASNSTVYLPRAAVASSYPMSPLPDRIVHWQFAMLQNPGHCRVTAWLTLVPEP